MLHLFVYPLSLQQPDPKEMQINLTGFLHGKNARIFMQELWDLLLSAQDNIGWCAVLTLCACE